MDHNVGTLDGKGSVHGMAITAVSTPHSAIPRVITRQQRIKTNELVREKGIPILYYVAPTEKGLASVFFKPVVELQVPHTLPPELYSNLLWHSGWMFSKAAVPSSNWSGFMQNAFCNCNGSTFKSEVFYPSLT